MLKRFTKEILIYGIIGGLGKTIMVLLAPLFTQYFLPDEMAVLDLATGLITFLTLIGMLQMESSSGRFFYDNSVEKRKHIISKSIFFIFGLSVILSLLLVLFSGNISELLFENSSYKKLIILGAIILPLGNLFSYQMSMMRYLKKPIHYGVIYLVQILVTLVLSVVFIAYLNTGIYGFFYAKIIGLFVGLISVLLYMARAKLLIIVFNFQILKKSLAYNLPLMPGLIAVWSNIYLSRFLLLSMVGLADIGLLSLAFRVGTICALIEQAIKMTWNPFLFESLKKEGHKEMIRKVFSLLTVLVFSFAGLLILFMPEIFDIFIDEKYTAALMLSTIIVLPLTIRILDQIVIIGPSIVKKTQYNSYLTMAVLTLNIVLIYVIVPEYGVIGVPISLGIASIFKIFVGNAISEKLYSVKLNMKLFLIMLITIIMWCFFNLKMQIPLYGKILIAVVMIFIIAQFLFYKFKGKKGMLSYEA